MSKIALLLLVLSTLILIKITSNLGQPEILNLSHFPRPYGNDSEDAHAFPEFRRFSTNKQRTEQLSPKMTHQWIKRIHREWDKLLSNHSYEGGEPNSAGLNLETIFYIETVHNILANKSNASNILVCEIGFNMGHSAITFLFSDYLYRVQYFGFSLDLVNQELISMLLKDKYAPNAMSVIFGDSTKTVPEYIKILKRTNELHQCDIVVVDGGHIAPVPFNDLQNMKALAKIDGSVLILDDCSCTAKWCLDPTQAWEKSIDAGLVRHTGVRTIRKGRGWCWGEYIFE